MFCFVFILIYSSSYVLATYFFLELEPKSVMPLQDVEVHILQDWDYCSVTVWLYLVYISHIFVSYYECYKMREVP